MWLLLIYCVTVNGLTLRTAHTGVPPTSYLGRGSKAVQACCWLGVTLSVVLLLFFKIMYSTISSLADLQGATIVCLRTSICSWFCGGRGALKCCDTWNFLVLVHVEICLWIAQGSLWFVAKFTCTSFVHMLKLVYFPSWFTYGNSWFYCLLQETLLYHCYTMSSRML